MNEWINEYNDKIIQLIWVLNQLTEGQHPVPPTTPGNRFSIAYTTHKFQFYHNSSEWKFNFKQNHPIFTGKPSNFVSKSHKTTIFAHKTRIFAIKPPFCHWTPPFSPVKPPRFRQRPPARPVPRRPRPAGRGVPRRPRLGAMGWFITPIVANCWVSDIRNLWAPQFQPSETSSQSGVEGNPSVRKIHCQSIWNHQPVNISLYQMWIE